MTTTDPAPPCACPPGYEDGGCVFPPGACGRRELSCPQCGGDTTELHEGYCQPCCEANQLALDLHNAEVDRWSKLTDSERARAIRWAMR